jgi:hypothetical protein
MKPKRPTRTKELAARTALAIRRPPPPDVPVRQVPEVSERGGLAKATPAAATPGALWAALAFRSPDAYSTAKGQSDSAFSGIDASDAVYADASQPRDPRFTR